MALANKSVSGGREPTKAERAAIQKAVDAGDLRRARELIAGVRRRLTATRRRSEKQKRKAVRILQPGPQKPSVKRTAARTVTAAPAKPGKTKRNTALPSKACVRCSAKFRPDNGRQQLCSICRPRSSRSKSVRTVSGGLPGLGKRR
jgi:hypothetical protein